MPTEKLQVVPVQPVPTVIVRPPTAPKSYSGQTSYKAYKEYFERLSICNGWDSPLIKAQNLLINLEGAASEAVRGLEVTNDEDYSKIWEMLKRRFSFQDDVEQTRRAFDRRTQNENESTAQFELSLRLLYHEAWPSNDIKGPDADSALQRHFINGICEESLQKYLRLHARTDTFATTVEKAKLYVEANELTSSKVKKPAVHFANDTEQSSDDTYADQILNGIQKVLRAVEQNAVTSASSSTTSQRTENIVSNRSSNGSNNNNNNTRNNGNNYRSNSPPARVSDGSRNQNFSPNRENRDPNANRGRHNFSSPPPNSSSRNEPPVDRGYNNGNSRRNANNANSSRGQPNNQFNAPNYGQRNNGYRNNRSPRQQYFNRNFSGNSPRNRTSPRPNRRGCHICGEIGCHTRLHENGRARVQTERRDDDPPSRNTVSPNPPARDATVRYSEMQHICPICGRLRCTDPFCINQMRQKLDVFPCATCWSRDCPNPQNCKDGTWQADGSLTPQRFVSQASENLKSPGRVVQGDHTPNQQ